MAKTAGQKLKLLTLARLLWENTDEDHGLSVQEMIDSLEANGIAAERKSIYDDLESLRTFGLDIECHKSKKWDYYIASRTFQTPELKLLVDAVQSSRFITLRKSNELIKKLESLTSRQEASALQRQVYVADRIKTMNESIYYNVDTLHAAIAQNRQVTFHYFSWTSAKKKQLG
ncbi:MAG: WYL domain-containing protein, partial [Pygmaiobacter sp.]